MLNDTDVFLCMFIRLKYVDYQKFLEQSEAEEEERFHDVEFQITNKVDGQDKFNNIIFKYSTFAFIITIYS